MNQSKYGTNAALWTLNDRFFRGIPYRFHLVGLAEISFNRLQVSPFSNYDITFPLPSAFLQVEVDLRPQPLRSVGAWFDVGITPGCVARGGLECVFRELECSA